jgi:hypothetical protein
MIAIQEERFAFLPEKVRLAFFFVPGLRFSPEKHLKTRGNASVFSNKSVFFRAEHTEIFMLFEVWGVAF